MEILMAHDDYYLPRLSDEYETEGAVIVQASCVKCGYEDAQAEVLASGNWYRWAGFWECPKCKTEHTHMGEWETE
jgi:predicted Zn-ribbon and HTH transcriptional regulator